MGNTFAGALPHFRDATQAGCLRDPGGRLKELPVPPERNKNNLRTGLILASVVLVFFLGYMVRMILLKA